jgi:hypothetical protein
MNFQDKVTQYTGTITDTAGLSQWLTQGAKHITDLLSDEKVRMYAQTLSITTNIYNYRILEVGSGYPARPINYNEISSAQDVNSINYATTRSPRYYIKDGSLITIPLGISCLAMLYPTVQYSDSTIDKFPSELEDAVILFASMRSLLQQTNALALSISSIASPDYTDFTTAMTQEDIELATEFLDKVKTRLSEFSQDVQQIIQQISTNLKTIENLQGLYKEELTKL